MVSAVISVRPTARVEEAASVLLANRISAVPVIDERGRLLGIVSEGDLLRRVESETRRRRSWWLEYLTGKQVLAAEYVKTSSKADVLSATSRAAKGTKKADSTSRPMRE
jgi:CBS domain-containing protein